MSQSTPNGQENKHIKWQSKLDNFMNAVFDESATPYPTLHVIMVVLVASALIILAGTIFAFAVKVIYELLGGNAIVFAFIIAMVGYWTKWYFDQRHRWRD